MEKVRAARSSLLTRLTIIPLLVLAAANVAFVLEFWASFGGDDAILFQIVGGALALIEPTFLVVAAEAAHRGESTKASVWRGVFILVLAVNGMADFGAIVTKTAADQAQRAGQAAIYDAAATINTAAGMEIQRLSVLLDGKNANRPIDALSAEVDAAFERHGGYVSQGLQPPRRVVERLADAKGNLAIAQELKIQRDAQADARAVLGRMGQRPLESHPQFEGLAEFLALVGLRVTPENVRVVLAVGLAAVVKLVLVFGFWVTSARLRVDEDLKTAPTEDEAGCAPARPSDVAPPAPSDGAMTDRRRPKARSDAGAKAPSSVHAALDDLEKGIV